MSKCKSDSKRSYQLSTETGFEAIGAELLGEKGLRAMGTAYGWLVHPAFHGLSAFVSAGLVFAGVSDTCGMGMLLAKMPWNQTKNALT